MSGDRCFASVCILAVCLLVNVCLSSAFNLTVLHTNDIHARYEETNKYSGSCSDNNCYGGLGRLKTKIEEFRAAVPNTILLDGGDMYQGTIWFNQFGGALSGFFANFLGYDAMALGNHEFDRGISGLIPFLDNTTFPVLSSNIEDSMEPSIQGKYAKSTVLSVGGKQIGVIGYTTKDTTIISNPGSLTFNDEITSVRAEVTRLQGQGINIIIAVGHAGYVVDKQMATEVDGLDIIVGGHSNTFLYTGDAPSNEFPVAAYPTVITQTNGNTVLVVQDYAYGKYLGVLNVTFDDQGQITQYAGNPVLLDSSVPKDPAAKVLLDIYRPEIIAFQNKVAGRSLVRMEGDRLVCRRQECNMGNMIADAMVYQNLRHADSLATSRIFIALVNSGSIRSSFDQGNITFANIIEVQPFRNTLETIRLQGRHLRAALENSVSRWNTVDPSGRFLQVSGLRVTYDLKKEVGRRVVDVHALCSDCTIPEYLPLDDTKMYRIILSNFIVQGGDGYDVIRDNAEQEHISGDLDSDVMTEYIQEISPLYHGLEGRIKFINGTEIEQCVGAGIATRSASLLTLITVVILQSVLTR
ncbi:snake venom 5'-nucleotidase-like [Ylistrum balloti]|uniref:snake venom 5'-nucleotidase-like n=1 Tax=Ylistrum balloti TaxID=509963 RepID=UPI002905997E|nr:snake venom 5'-nucleotidase-like [Ylistrum balloti]